MMEVREILPSLERVNSPGHGVAIEPGPSRPQEEPARAPEPVQAIPPLEKVTKATGEPPRPPEPPVLTKVGPERLVVPELVKVTTEKVTAVEPEASEVPKLDLAEVANSVSAPEKSAIITPGSIAGAKMKQGDMLRVVRKPNQHEEDLAAREGAQWVSTMDQYLNRVGSVETYDNKKVALRFYTREGISGRPWWFLRTCVVPEKSDSLEFSAVVTETEPTLEIPTLQKVDAKKAKVGIAELSYVILGFHHGTGEFDFLGTTSTPSKFLRVCVSTTSEVHKGKPAVGELLKREVPPAFKELGVCVMYDWVDGVEYPLDDNPPALSLIDTDDPDAETVDVESMPAWNRSDTSTSYTWMLIATQVDCQVRVPFSRLESLLY